MVCIDYCSFCKYFYGFAEDRVTYFCEAFPKGQDHFEPEINQECAKGFSFEPKVEYKEFFEHRKTHDQL